MTKSKKSKKDPNSYRGVKYRSPCCNNPSRKWCSDWKDESGTCVNCGKTMRPITVGWLKTPNGKKFKEKSRER